MLGNAFQVTWVKIHFLIVRYFHILQVLHSTARPYLWHCTIWRGRERLSLLLTFWLQHVKWIVTVCDKIINPDNF